MCAKILLSMLRIFGRPLKGLKVKEINWGGGAWRGGN